MRVMVATHRPTPPFFFGGVEVGNRLLGEEARRGRHDVLHLGSFTHPRWRDERLLVDYLRRLGGRAEVSMRGTRVQQVRYSTAAGECRMVQATGFRAALVEALGSWSPDLVVTSCAGSREICAAAATQGVPTMSWVQDVGVDGRESAAAAATWTAYASTFLRRVVPPVSGDGFVLHPPFTVVPPPSPPPADPVVLLVNPIPEKGGDLFRELATRLPRYRFHGLTGWRTPEWADGEHPTNLRCLPRRDRPDPVYRSSSLVVVPSRLPEGFGRTVVEGAQHGRRVLCHAIGALPETSSVEANLLPDLDADRWEEAIVQALRDRHGTAMAIREARDHASRLVKPLLPELAAETGLHRLTG